MSPFSDEAPAGYRGRHTSGPDLDDAIMADLIDARMAWLRASREQDAYDASINAARQRLYEQGHTTATAMAAINAAWPEVVEFADGFLAEIDRMTGGTA